MPHRRNLTTAERFHLLNRGVDGQDIFGIEADRRFFLWLLGYLAERRGVRIEAYALMTNHFHLLIDRSDTTPDEVSAFMRDLEAGYAFMFNARTRRRGPLFESRFTSIPVLSTAQYLQLARYIHRNPIDITGASGVAAYAWSSLAVYLGRRRAPRWLSTDKLTSLISPDRHLQRVLAAEVDDLFGRGFRSPERTVSITTLLEAVDSVGVALGDVPEAQRSLVELAARVALTLRVDDVVVLAEAFGIHERTLRRRSARAKIRLVDDCSYRALHDRLLNEVLRRSSAA